MNCNSEKITASRVHEMKLALYSSNLSGDQSREYMGVMALLRSAHNFKQDSDYQLSQSRFSYNSGLMQWKAMH